MAYVPPVSSEALSKAVDYYSRFLLITLIVGLGLFSSFFIWPDSLVWQGNILWNTGSFVTITSVISNRYCNIRKRANPRIQNFNESVIQSLSLFRQKILKAERVIDLSWFVGTSLLIVSRWFKF